MLSSLPLVVCACEFLKLMHKDCAILAQMGEPFAIARVTGSHLSIGGDGMSQHILCQDAQFRTQVGPVECFAKRSDIRKVAICVALFILIVATIKIGKAFVRCLQTITQSGYRLARRVAARYTRHVNQAYRVGRD